MVWFVLRHSIIGVQRSYGSVQNNWTVNFSDWLVHLKHVGPGFQSEVGSSKTRQTWNSASCRFIKNKCHLEFRRPSVPNKRNVDHIHIRVKIHYPTIIPDPRIKCQYKNFSIIHRPPGATDAQNLNFHDFRAVFRQFPRFPLDFRPGGRKMVEKLKKAEKCLKPDNSPKMALKPRKYG